MSYLHAFGACLPPRVVSNAELALRAGCTAEWIESASGIRERRWAAPGSTVADMAVDAAQDCLVRAGAHTSQIGLLIVTSGSAPHGFPGPSAEIANRLGLGSTPAFDIPMASAGGLFALSLAAQLAPAYGDVLVIASEKMSAIVEAHALDRNTAILFGDGAGAALVSARPAPLKILDSVLHTDGQYRHELAYDGRSALHMNGLAIILQAARKLPAVIQEVLQKHGVTPAEVQTFLLHQANKNLLLKVARSLHVPESRVFSNVEQYGNTSSASLLIAAHEWQQQPSVAGPVVFAAFGAGLQWGALLAERQ
jgi:3-oxoacyl-[acyl-carrier-protein] synthase III